MVNIIIKIVFCEIVYVRKNNGLIKKGSKEEKTNCCFDVMLPLPS